MDINSEERAHDFAISVPGEGGGSAGVSGVSGTAPIDVDNASPAYPVIRITLGTTANTVSEGDHTHVEYAPLASPTFTGAPEAPTPADNSTPNALATTQYVADNAGYDDTAIQAEVDLNTAKVTYDDAVLVAQHTTDISTNAGNIANKINSISEETGETVIPNAVHMTGAAYDAVTTPVTDKLYILTTPATP